MTPQEELYELIKARAIEMGAEPDDDGDYDGCDEWYDAMYEVRCCGEETNLPSPRYSRHYELEQVAAQCPSGRWVSWTYYYGGGKHGNPEEIDWISDAFYVNCKEEQVMVTKRTFKAVK